MVQIFNITAMGFTREEEELEDSQPATNPGEGNTGQPENQPGNMKVGGWG